MLKLNKIRTACQCRIRNISTKHERNCYDIVVVGGGIVGIASALEIVTRKPHLSVAVVEKENVIAAHQSGHNSGVVHAGIYYKPGSLRAQLCTKGMQLSYQYFDKNSVPYRKVGKLIVATDDSQIPALETLYQRGLDNGVPDLKMISGDEIKSIEPHCIGVKAVHSPQTGIVDWGEVTRIFARDFESRNGKIYLDFKLTSFKENKEKTEDNEDLEKCPVRLVSSRGESVNCGYVLCCGGLHSDKLAVLSGGAKYPPIVPVRGEYLILSKEKQSLVKGNIYPVPDARFPFLGVHFTPRMDGSIWIGPNAVLACSREGYRYSNINVKDFMDIVTYKGFQKLAFKYYDFAVQEFIKSVILSRNLKELQKFIPTLTKKDILRGPSGVRAQAVNEGGELIEDFVFDEPSPDSNPIAKRVLHCRNAPSPAATSSLAIAQILADKMFKLMNIDPRENAPSATS